MQNPDDSLPESDSPALFMIRRIPAITLSANVMQGDIGQALEAGLLEYIAEPIDIPEFIKTIKKLVRK
ncbi:hypothetical protein UR09_04730 [Candidatus Nitromaritima sp. SCGC AAA799-A02]|nr:hypothetical protein UR09_04730 [Candidatus Nitromaritima sp. SCGC AAA799-A02]KMP12454.1 hypothetical protein UZ36_00935 [Candidatus Nitromaritima sp. SCGC AAA799-C22]